MEIPHWVRAVVFAPLKRLLGPQRWEALRHRCLRVQRTVDDMQANRRFHRTTPSLFVISEAAQIHFYTPFLHWLESADPDLRARIVLDHLPAEVPRGVQVMHAWIQDPVLERDPSVFHAVERLEKHVLAAGGNVIQPVRVLSHSQRDEMFARLQRVGVRSPKIVEYSARFDEDVTSLGSPMVVRRRWGHGLPLELLADEAAVAEWRLIAEQAPQDWVAAEYIDTRSEDGLFRKYRYVMIGDRGLSRHLIVSNRWEVRPYDRVVTPETIAEELRFVNAECPQHDEFNRAREALEFDIAAFDYSFDREGRMIVWEVNPFPDLSLPHGKPGEYLATAFQKTNELLAGFYREKLRAAA